MDALKLAETESTLWAEAQVVQDQRTAPQIRGIIKRKEEQKSHSCSSLLPSSADLSLLDSNPDLRYGLQCPPLMYYELHLRIAILGILRRIYWDMTARNQVGGRNKCEWRKNEVFLINIFELCLFDLLGVFYLIPGKLVHYL